MIDTKDNIMIDASMFYGIVVGSVLAVNILYWLHKKDLL